MTAKSDPRRIIAEIELFTLTIVGGGGGGSGGNTEIKAAPRDLNEGAAMVSGGAGGGGVPEGAVVKEYYGAGSGGNKTKILIGDAGAELIVRALADAGFKIIEASQGRERK